MNFSRKRYPNGRKNKARGVAIVEFALVAVLFLTVLLSTMEYAYLFFGNLSMQHAVREGARYAVTGLSDLDPVHHDRCAAARTRIIDQSMGFFDRSAATIDFKVVNKSTGRIEPPSSTCGDKNDIVVITVSCHLPLLTPFLRPFFTDGAKSGVYAFSVGTAMKNEAFK